MARAWWIGLALLTIACRSSERDKRAEAVAVPVAEVDARPPHSVPAPTRLTSRVFVAGRFAGPERLVLQEDEDKFCFLDASAAAVPTADASCLQLPLHGVDDSARFVADAYGAVWFTFNEMQLARGEIFGAGFGATPKVLGSYGQHPLGADLDASEVLLARSNMSYCPSCTDDGEVVAFGRTAKRSRVVVKVPEIISFGMDETDIYWLEGLHDSKLFRAKKSGGPHVEVAAPGVQGRIFVLRDHVVHHPFGFGQPTSVVPKSGGSFVAAMIDLESAVVAHDAAGLCWISHPHECDAGSCTIDPRTFESTIRCWRPDLAQPHAIDLVSPPTWLAISPARIAFGASDGVWTIARPK